MQVTAARCLALVINLGQRLAMLTILFAVASSPSPAAAQVQPAPPIMSVRPIISPPGERMLLAWMPGETRCGDAVVEAKPMRRPWTSLLWGTENYLKPVTYGFAIDTTGRTTGIHRLGTADYVASIEDLAPSLAATRFERGVARTGCTVTYVPRQTALSVTPIADLVSYTLSPLSGALPEAGWVRIRGIGNCADAPRPQPLIAVSPDFRALPATPGVKDWSMVSYDLDRKGRPIVVHVITGTGNEALDVAAVKAMSASRFTDGSARQGCFYPYWRAPATLAPPPIPEEEAVRPAGATCPSHHDWSVMPTLHFPEAYQRRAIEGWAIVTYDVAPWGEVGNARVVAAEPTAEFGTAALSVIRSAKVPTTQGLVGCVDRVRFKLP